jgi:hypothetical protein
MPASPKEFREFAQECLRWADETKSERHRQVLLDMAKTWMQAALQLERSLALIDDDLRRPRVPRPVLSQPNRPPELTASSSGFLTRRLAG